MDKDPNPCRAALPFIGTVTCRHRQGWEVQPIPSSAEDERIGLETVCLQPDRFVLGRTLEWVELPILADQETCLAARIEGKSSRRGSGSLSTSPSPTVHPGFAGTLTLEMINLGPSSFMLRPGMAIAQLIVEEVRGRPIRNPSQFQGQQNPAG